MSIHIGSQIEDFNVGLCKPSQTEVFYRGHGGSQVFLPVRDEWPASLLCTEALCLLHPARSCSRDMGDGFQIPLMHPF